MDSSSDSDLGSVVDFDDNKSDEDTNGAVFCIAPLRTSGQKRSNSSNNSSKDVLPPSAKKAWRTQQALRQVQQQEKAKQQQQATTPKNKNGVIALLDSDDDEDEEEKGVAKAQAPRKATPSNNTINLLLDDDDDSSMDEEIHVQRQYALATQAQADTIQALARSRRAAQSLELAQQQRRRQRGIATVDFLEDDDDDDDDEEEEATAVQPNACTSTLRTNLGSMLQLTCRTKNPNDRKETCKSFQMQLHQPLTKLKDQLLVALGLNNNTVVRGTFDGHVLVWTKTPADYEMETGDMIDVQILSTAALAPRRVASTTTKRGIRLPLHLQYKDERGKLVRKALLWSFQEPLQGLLHEFNKHHMRAGRALVFDGECLNLSKTPHQVDMEDGDVLDVLFY